MRVLFKIILSFLIIIFNFNIINFAETNKISEIKITIDVKTDGSAIVTEIWNANIYSGTELYHSFENINSSTITDFSVFEDGIKYKQKKEWDITRNAGR